MSSSQGLRKVTLPQKSMESVFSQIRGFGCDIENHDVACFGDLPYRLSRYLEGEPMDFPDKLDLSGATYFQQDVWSVARMIPYGETRSYGWVASQLGLSKAARAVGQALGRNPLPIVVPCHRVIGSDGSLGGFSGGLEMKKYLLGLESTLV